MLPVGKLPNELLARLLARAPANDSRILIGPGIGLDCAVIDFGETLLVMKSDPITFATGEIGWYAVQVNANDLATTGADPRWLMLTLLLPEGRTSFDLVERITGQVYKAAAEIGVSVVGGHTEITYGLDRPVLSCTLIGEVNRHKLITPRGGHPGDRLLITKGAPIEATAILAHEMPEQLSQLLSPPEIERARRFLIDPGISVLRDSKIAARAGRVTAMHDPTEGGVASALWELAQAGGYSLVVDPLAIPVPELSLRICTALGLDPLASIASGALLLTVDSSDCPQIRSALEGEGIACAEIGRVEPGPPSVWRVSSSGRDLFPRPSRDEIARLFEDRPGNPL